MILKLIKTKYFCRSINLRPLPCTLLFHLKIPLVILFIYKIQLFWFSTFFIFILFFTTLVYKQNQW